MIALARALLRILELTAENQKLKQELQQRRKQADTWRRKFHSTKWARDARY